MTFKTDSLNLAYAMDYRSAVDAAENHLQSALHEEQYSAVFKITMALREIRKAENALILLRGHFQEEI